MVPIEGGSGQWDYGDSRRSQHDSTNRILSAALSADRRLLYIQETGPLHFDPKHYPVFWHQELYLGVPGNPGAALKLLALFDEVSGMPTTDSGTVNWVADLQWLDNNRFLAVGGHLFPEPERAVKPLGLFVGTITSDTVLMEHVDNLGGIVGWSVTPDGLVLLQSNAQLSLLTLTDRRRATLATIPLENGQGLVASRCDVSYCWAISRSSDTNSPGWDVWQIDRSLGQLRHLRTVGSTLPGDLALPPSGTSAIVTHLGILYRIDRVLSP
jgi:hypothetical protein